MDKLELENAIMSIFLQCLNEPEILEIMKGKLSSIDGSFDHQENLIQKPYIYTDDNSTLINMYVIPKLDEILTKQKSIEEYIKAGTYKETKFRKLEDTKKGYGLPIRSENESKYKVLLEDSQFSNERLKGEKEELSAKYESLKDELKIEKSKYSIFEEILEVWNCINSLNDDNREYIDSLCGSAQLLAVLSLGRDDGKIEQLWLYLRDTAIKGGIERAEVLKLNRYFEFCLKVGNSIKPESEKYVISDIELGSEFDIDMCIRTSDSKQIGYVREVVVKQVKIGRNIKFKAIVKVE